MYKYQGEVLRVIDADTFEIKVDYGFKEYGIKTFRLHGIDTPEIYRPTNEVELNHGIDAKMFVERLILGKTCILETFKQRLHIYGRYDVQIHLSEEQRKLAGSIGAFTLSDALAAKGFAKKKPEFYKDLLSKGLNYDGEELRNGSKT